MKYHLEVALELKHAKHSRLLGCLAVQTVNFVSDLKAISSGHQCRGSPVPPAGGARGGGSAAQCQGIP